MEGMGMARGQQNLVMVGTVAMVVREVMEDMEDMAMAMVGMALAAMEGMGMARGQQNLVMVGTVAMVVTRVMVVIEVMATMAEKKPDPNDDDKNSTREPVK